jgi:hypothetical protein
MPGRDATGPRGEGPTGRQMGDCGSGQPGADAPFGFGRRMGRRGRGMRGFGFSRGGAGAYDLTAHKTALENELERINNILSKDKPNE